MLDTVLMQDVRDAKNAYIMSFNFGGRPKKQVFLQSGKSELKRLIADHHKIPFPQMTKVKNWDFSFFEDVPSKEIADIFHFINQEINVFDISNGFIEYIPFFGSYNYCNNYRQWFLDAEKNKKVYEIE